MSVVERGKTERKWARSSLQCPAGHSRSFTCYGLMYECHDCYTGNGYGRKFYFVKGEPIFSEPLEGAVTR